MKLKEESHEEKITRVYNRISTKSYNLGIDLVDPKRLAEFIVELTEVND